jgi:CRP/FNR family transcriptional regulator
VAEGAPSCPKRCQAQLFHAAQARHLKAGERLFAIGDPGDGCFLLEQGLLKATVASRLGEERIIAILGPGTIVGELSMFDGLPRSASVVAMRDCMLRFVRRGGLSATRQYELRSPPGTPGDPSHPVAASV